MSPEMAAATKNPASQDGGGASPAAPCLLDGTAHT